ncbi:MAG: LolA family protein [Armatimonadota bacterium]
MRRLTILLVLLASVVFAKQMTVKDVIDKAAAHFDKVRDYTVEAKLSVEAPNLHIPEMRMKIYYKKPGKLHVESKDGFAVLPKKGVLIGNPVREFSKDCKFTLADGEGCYLLSDEKTKTTFRIDKKNFLLTRISTQDEQGKVGFDIEYVKVAKRYWLPEKTTARIKTPGRKDAVITLKFENYRVNTGLNDKIFEEGSK